MLPLSETINEVFDARTVALLRNLQMSRKNNPFVLTLIEQKYHFNISFFSLIPPCPQQTQHPYPDRVPTHEARQTELPPGQVLLWSAEDQEGYFI